MFDYRTLLISQRTPSIVHFVSTSQTLSRGLTALEFVALSEQAPSIDQVARHLDVHRSVAYRIVRTLEEHRLVRRDADGCCQPGVQLAALGRCAQPTFQSLAAVELPRVADELGMTSFLVVRDGDEALTLASFEPTNSQFHVAYKPGIRHDVTLGAPGVALLAGNAPIDGERTAVTESRQRGWASTNGEVIAGMGSVAAPVAGTDAAIATVFLNGALPALEPIGQRLVAAAAAIAEQLAPHADDHDVASAARRIAS